MTHRHLVVSLGCGVALACLTITGCGSSNSKSTASSGLPDGPATLAQVQAGRAIVMSSGCGDCHNRGKTDPSDAHWLAGFVGAAGASGQGAFDIGPFKTYAANLTPDMTNGIGMHSARQIFNALRYGLDPMDTPDVVITSTTPGTGNFPATPHYLAPPMPWPAIRHNSDAALWQIAAYLLHGVKADSNVVPDSAGPPDFWASSATPAAAGAYPALAFPAASEVFKP